ncbi:hypothetical protein [Roseovarius sp. MMSF_3281]|uniref:hypothetical protein n=1 Tax=Roseovarius sp. MMSF_3281 TaxID=3046694 RepID=UPI00273EFB53|nr:hypothetical protein [Roseovarius sp. MMSF_3281]
MSDPVGEARSKALFEARKAYSNEARRLRRDPEKINSRCLIVAIDAFNEAFAELTSEDDFDVIDN